MSSIWTIRRSASDAKVTGLCGGLAAHWGVDPVLVRVGAVLLALSGGIGLVLYLAGWLLVPVQGAQLAPVHEVLGKQARTWPREVWIAVVALTCIFAFGTIGTLSPFGFGPIAILALLWYFGYYKNRPHRQDPGHPEQGAGQQGSPPVVGGQPHQFVSYPGAPTPFTDAAEEWRQRVEQVSRSAAQPPPPSATPLPPAAPLGWPSSFDPGPDGSPPWRAAESREPDGPAETLPPAHPLGAESLALSQYLTLPDPAGIYSAGYAGATAVPTPPTSRSRSRSARRLRLVSVIALGLTLAALGVADAQGVTVPRAGYLASALLVLGLTLVAAAWCGRARGILGVTFLVLLATLASVVAGPVADQRGWGVRQVTYTAPAQLVRGDRQELGSLTVDLSRLALAGNAAYTAHLGTGQLEVVAPPNANVVVHWSVKAGAVVDNGTQLQSGSGLSGVLDPGRPRPRTPTLTLTLSVDQGVIKVRR